MLVAVAVRGASADALMVRLSAEKHFTDADVLAFQRLNPDLRVEQDVGGTLSPVP
jgi:hypothetical protein